MIAKAQAEAVARQIIQKTRGREVLLAQRWYIWSSHMAWNRLIPLDLREVLIKYPGAFNAIASQQINFQGQSLMLLFAPRSFNVTTVPYGWSVSDEFKSIRSPASRDMFMQGLAKSGEIIAALERVVEARDHLAALVVEVNEAQTKLAATIRGHASWKALAKAWPEIAPQIPTQYLAPPARTTQALVNYAAINKLAGLPIPEVQP